MCEGSEQKKEKQCKSWLGRKWLNVRLFVHDWRKAVVGNRRCAVPLDKECGATWIGRGVLIFLGMLCVAGAVVAKFGKIQFLEHEKHLSNADKILGFEQRLIGVRGEIYDYGKNLLVGNIRTRDLYATPQVIMAAKDAEKVMDSFCEFLSGYSSFTKEQLAEKFRKALSRDVSVMAAEVVGADVALDIQKLGYSFVEVVPCSKPIYKDYSSILIYPRRESDLVKLQNAVIELAKKLQLEQGDLLNEVDRALKRRTAVKLDADISLEEAKSLYSAFLEWAEVRKKNGKFLKYRVGIDAIHFDESTRRYYPKGRVLSNVLGFCRTDEKRKKTGQSGIELLMDAELRNSFSTRHLIPDGNVLASNFSPVVYMDELNGSNVHLTIQYPIQQIVEQEMEQLVAQTTPMRAYALMMDPKTGAIMALAQYPNFDATDERTMLPENREFHALMSIYEPGSIMKGVSVSSAMNAGNWSPEKVVFCENGVWHYGGRALHEHGSAAFGDLTLRQIIQKSSNIGSAKIVVETMSNQTFYNYLRAYGFGQRTGVGFYPAEGKSRRFSSETRGRLNNVEKWADVDVTRIAIGHTISISPFQMVQAYSAICNGGKMMQPYIVDRIETPDGKVIRSVPTCKGEPISATTAERILDCLSATLERGGTGTSAVIDGYNVAGKTGTAMKLVPGPRGRPVYSKKLNVSSFIGLVPKENPAFVLLITVDEPHGAAQYGGSVCGKPFSRIASETLRFLQIPPSEVTGAVAERQLGGGTLSSN